MIKIPCRTFSVKVEKNNPDGTKTPIVVTALSVKDQIEHELIIQQVFDKLVETDDCRESKAVLEYIKNLK